MTKRDAIKHISYKIAYAKIDDSKWVDNVNVDALEIAVRAMEENRRMHTMLDVWDDNDELFVGSIRKELKGETKWAD